MVLLWIKSFVAISFILGYIIVLIFLLIRGLEKEKVWMLLIVGIMVCALFASEIALLNY